jgi:hypothetical protein
VMTDFMGNHIGLGEVPGCAQFVFQISVEAEVDIDLTIGRAVKRPCRCLLYTSDAADE